MGSISRVANRFALVPRKKKDLGGRPPHVPDDKSRAFVKSLLQAGRSQPDVCLILDVDPKTLRKYYRREVDTAALEGYASVGNSIFMRAVGGPRRDWQKADMRAAIFYAESRMRWDKPTPPRDPNAGDPAGGNTTTIIIKGGLPPKQAEVDTGAESAPPAGESEPAKEGG